MKKTFIIALFILYTSSIFSQISESFNYLPLKVGNTWIYGYNSIYGPSKTRLKIISELNVNGHKYFVFNQQGDTCKCSFNSYSPFLSQLSPMRVDSTTAKLMFYGSSCQWQINERLFDSLSMKIGDYTNSCNGNACLDTSEQNIFGTQRKTKRIGMLIPNYYYFRTYAKDIGLVSSVMGCYIGTTCSYNLLGCVINGVVYGDTSMLTGINQLNSEVPNNFSLSQNYPNPFNPTTNVKFQIPNSGFVKLIVYDLIGKEIQSLVNQQLSPGTYEVDFDGSNLPSGVYYYKLESDSYTETKKMVLIK